MMMRVTGKERFQMKPIDFELLLFLSYQKINKAYRLS